MSRLSWTDEEIVVKENRIIFEVNPISILPDVLGKLTDQYLIKRELDSVRALQRSYTEKHVTRN